ncbi:MAG: hypothetical protein ACRYGR_00715 [Janthinobacterium lividum]
MPYTHSGQKKKARQHPADVYAAEQAARCTSFSVVFSKGPGERIREDSGDQAEAFRIAERLNSEHGRHGRRAVVYGITPEGSTWPLSAPRSQEAAQ